MSGQQIVFGIMWVRARVCFYACVYLCVWNSLILQYVHTELEWNQFDWLYNTVTAIMTVSDCIVQFISISNPLDNVRIVEFIIDSNHPPKRMMMEQCNPN